MSWYRHLFIRIVPPGLCLAGVLCLANSGWIHSKAWLAQQLIAAAWQQSRQTGQVSKPWPWADTWPVGRLQLVDHAVDLFTLQGLTGNALAFGPGQVHLPGDVLLLAGHRDTHFQFMRDLSIGDQLRLTEHNGAWANYHIEEILVVDSRQQDVMALAYGANLLLVTCYPFDAVSANGPLRYVARASKQPSTIQL